MLLLLLDSSCHEATAVLNVFREIPSDRPHSDLSSSELYHSENELWLLVCAIFLFKPITQITPGPCFIKRLATGSWVSRHILLSRRCSPEIWIKRMTRSSIEEKEEMSSIPH